MEEAVFKDKKEFEMAVKIGEKICEEDIEMERQNANEQLKYDLLNLKERLYKFREYSIELNDIDDNLLDSFMSARTLLSLIEEMGQKGTSNDGDSK